MDVVGDFRQYVVQRQRSLLRLAWLLTGDWATAEDLVQTALVAVWPRWRRLGGGDQAHAYVRRVLVTTSRDWRARRWTGEQPVDQLPETTTSAQDDPDDRLVLVAALQALPPRQRAVIVLRFFDDASEQATADALRCSVGTVKSQTSKALTALRRHPSMVDLARTENSHD
ncbi:SigE family RNA polymerase sigma factor [Aquipuribacter hungaricus]|uniref:SigE family RNA polymerase sigma factor n=1 Tax=Aquipuribacter hungaricus TaxID=545624 RepID=A0ABV7WM96_9MICO